MADDSKPWLSDRERRRLTRRPSDMAMIATPAATGLIAAFMQTLVTPILPHLPHYLDTTMADASWVLTSTLLAAAIATPIAGRLGDMYGKRRMLLVLRDVLHWRNPGAAIALVSATLGVGGASRCCWRACASYRAAWSCSSSRARRRSSPRCGTSW